jgi:phenylalanyl-tRNA synthetase beta subunit
MIGTLVDLANLVSIRYALPVAVFDRRSIEGCLTVRFARGDEPWSDLGSSTAERPEPGEVIFADDADVVMAGVAGVRCPAAARRHVDIPVTETPRGRSRWVAPTT